MTSADDGQQPAHSPSARRRPHHQLGRVGRWARRHGCSERGAVLVESAFVFPVLITIILGVIDFGSAFNDYISLRQGVRESARETAISTLPQPSSGVWGDAQHPCPIAGAALGNTAVAPGIDYYDIFCYAKARIGLASPANIRISLYWDASAGAPKFGPRTGQADPDSVVICAQYQLNSITGLFGPILNNKVITAKTEIRIESTSADLSVNGLIPPIQETSLSTWPGYCTNL